MFSMVGMRGGGGCAGGASPTVGTRDMSLQGGHRVPVALLSPCPLCQAEPCCNTSRQRLAWPRLKALPSEYFMGLHGPGARALPRAFAGIYRKKQAEGEFLARGRPPASTQLRWARCLSHGQENGHVARGAGWDLDMAVAGGRCDGAGGAGEPLAPTHSPPPPPGCSTRDWGGDGELHPDAGPGAVGPGSAWCQRGWRVLQGQGEVGWSWVPALPRASVSPVMQQKRCS